MGCSDICSERRKNKKENMYEERRKKETEDQRRMEEENKFINKPLEEYKRMIGKELNKKDLEKYNEKNLKIEKEIKGKTDNNSVATNVEINANYLFKVDDTMENFDLNMINNLKGILKLLALKYISCITKPEKIKEIKNKDLIRIFENLNKDLELINKKGEIKKEEYISNDVQAILKEKEGSNIIEYAKYLNSMVSINDIKEIININELSEQNEIFKFLNNIIKFEKYNAFFEEEFSKAQLDSIFDYSIVNLVLLDNKNFLKYEDAKIHCPNCIKKVLFHGTQIDPASKIISSEFKFTRRAFYGMGIYFTDELDYATFYSGGDNLGNRRYNFNKVFPPNSTFTFIASEIFYDKNLFKHIRDKSYYVKELDHFPTYGEIKKKYKDKMVKKNGIHFITVRSDHGQVLEDSVTSFAERKKGKFIGNEYVITELEQICPIYAIKIKRNEYFLLWRDNHFEGKNFYYDYLKQRELYANGIAKMNIYIENNIENALKFIHKRRFNKMILITNIGLDLSGKKFIEVARKILGSNIIVLIYSSNKSHLKWIKNFPNVLYTNTSTLYKKYIKNYTENGLKQLKKEVENQYKIELPEFTDDFLSYPLYINNQKFSDINLSEKSQYIREISIYNSAANSSLIMKDNGQVELIKGKKVNFHWDITLVDDEITLYSNGYYLGYNKELKKIISNKFMERLNYIQIKSEDYKIKVDNDLFITINNNTLTIDNNNNENYSIFQFIDKN